MGSQLMQSLRRVGLMVAALVLSIPAYAESEWRAFSTPGGQAPVPLVLSDLAGKTVDLSSLKGQVVLVNFWATWCEPCRDEMPSLNRVHNRLKSKGFNVVGINIGETQARIKQFLDIVPVDFTILRDVDMSVMKSWRVRILPASYLVDKNGMLRYQLIGDANWDDPKMQAQILELMK